MSGFSLFECSTSHCFVTEKTGNIYVDAYAVEPDGCQRDSFKVYVGSFNDHLTGAIAGKNALITGVPVRDDGTFTGQKSYRGDLFIRDDEKNVVSAYSCSRLLTDYS